MIPFHTGMRVTGREFCGRRQELDELREYMCSAGRVYLVGERRVGKTSLIFEALRTLKGYRAVYVDLMAVKTVADVVQRLASALVRTEKQQSKVLTLLKGLAHLQPSLSFDPLTGVPTVGFSPTSGDRPESLDSVFALFAPWPDTVVVFDEFQDILEVPAEHAVIARLRGLIQHQDRTSFVFCGSIRHSMEAIFTHHDSPFFDAAMRMHVGPLNRTKFRKYLERKFTGGRRRLEDGLLDSIIEICGDNPGAVQRFCTALWLVTDQGDVIKAADLTGAWNRLFAMQSEQYGIIMQGLSTQQSQTLRALADGGGRSNLSRDFLARTGIPLQSSVSRALQGLIAKRVVLKEGTTYRICDPFLAGWLVSRLR